MTKPLWSLQEAIQLIRQIQPIVKKFNFHVLLGGGVLNKGISYNDLDLYFIPLEDEESDIKGLLTFLVDQISNSEGSGEAPSDCAESTYRQKAVIWYNKKKIDIFIV